MEVTIVEALNHATLFEFRSQRLIAMVTRMPEGEWNVALFATPGHRLRRHEKDSQHLELLDALARAKEVTNGR